MIATATVYAARFYYYKAYRDHHPHLIGATALHLASKVEEHHIALRNIEKAANELVKFQYKVSDIIDGADPKSNNKFFFISLSFASQCGPTRWILCARQGSAD